MKKSSRPKLATASEIASEFHKLDDLGKAKTIGYIQGLMAHGEPLRIQSDHRDSA